MVPKQHEDAPECKDCGLIFANERTKKKHLLSKKHRKAQIILPKVLIPIPNKDKEYHEVWKNGDDELDFPHPFRAILSGGVNMGKTNTIKNILVRQKPHFERIVVIHCDAGYTREYEDVEAEMMSEIPPPSFWDGKQKTIVILDDIEYKNLNKEQQSNLDRLFGFCSTHKNISICSTCQDFFNLFPSAKRMSNLFIIWRSNDMDSFKTISRKCGIKMDDFMKYFDTFTERRDSLWIDLTEKTPFNIRKNGYILL